METFCKVNEDLSTSPEKRTKTIQVVGFQNYARRLRNRLPPLFPSGTAYSDYTGY